MTRSAAAILVLILASAARAQSTQPAQAAPNRSSVPWAVSVVHTIDLQKMVELMREQQKLRVGVAGTAPRYIYNITTGIIVDGQGHVVTRLTNLDPQEKEHKLAVTTSDGITLTAKLIGVDFATGFAVLEVASLNATKPNIAGSGSLLNGAPVKILSSDVVPKSITDKVYLAPSITVSQGHVLVDSIYSRARGALTLLSDSLLARRDSSVVVSPENQVIGIVQYAGFGRAYLYPIEFIRDTVAKRVIEKKDNVPAGWLGVKGDSVAQLSDADAGALGLQRKAGVIVRQVTPESAAAQAGIMLSDIITRVDEFDIAGTADLKALLSSLPAGQAVKLRAIRDHQLVELKAVLGPRPFNEPEYLPSPFDQTAESALGERDQLERRFQELKAKLQSYQKSPPSRETNEAVRELVIEIRQIHESLRAFGPETTGQPQRAGQPASQMDYAGGNLTGEQLTADISFPAGFTARDLTSQLSATLHARGGVLVTNVAKDSAAERAGLKAGDVIVGMRDSVLVRAAQLQALLSTQHGIVALKVVRKKEPVGVSLNLP
ncbi:MAG: PDZ domain-containing protein [Acidobacteriota bacterium]